MKGYSLAILGLITCLGAVSPLSACEQFKEKADRYSDLKRHGGSAKQMNRWSAQRQTYSDRYRECVKAQPSMHRASGSKKHSKNQQKREAHRLVTSGNPLEIKLTNTCNFWIDTYNQKPTALNRTYKDTACRALDDAQSKPQSSQMAVATDYQRPLKDCIKPNNLMDEEVYDCMKGTRDPDWQ